MAARKRRGVRVCFGKSFIAVARLGVAVSMVLGAASPCVADAALSIPLARGAERIGVDYDCGAYGSVHATYYNAGEDHLAVVDLTGGRRILAGVIAASGARYAGGPYIWWTKGDEATLYDITQGGEDTPVATCSVR